jgi:hypothetical protein
MLSVQDDRRAAGARDIAAASGYATIRTVLRANNSAALALNHKCGYRSRQA